MRQEILTCDICDKKVDFIHSATLKIQDITCAFDVCSMCFGAINNVAIFQSIWKRLFNKNNCNKRR